MMSWHLKCVVPVFFALVISDAIQNETCANAEIDDASLLQKTDKLVTNTTDGIHAIYDGNCRPSQRQNENSEPLLSPDVIEAGQKCVLLMDVAYLLKGGREAFTDPEELKLVEKFKEELTDITQARVGASGAFGMAAKWKGMFVVSMAGTTDGPDVWADLKSVKARNLDLGGKTYSVGHGFADHYDGIRKILGPVFEKELKSPGTPVLVVGHSLGGAIANLAAVDLANKYKARVRLVTAGSPRVFDYWDKGEGTLKNSAKAVQEDLIVDGVGKESAANGYCVEPPAKAGKICTERWVNYADAVPQVPPFTEGYFHVGNGAFLINQKNCYWSGVNPMTAIPQHEDYTAYNHGWNAYANHGLKRYYDRMLWAMEGKADGGRTANCR